MKILHCPKGEDPLTYARGATRRGGGGLGGLLQGNGLLIGLVVTMIVGTFTIGPLRPKSKEQQLQLPPEPTAAAVQAEPLQAPVVYAEQVLCDLPAGGRIEAGWEMLVDDGRGEIIKVRCEDDGTLKEIETTF